MAFLCAGAEQSEITQPSASPAKPAGSDSRLPTECVYGHATLKKVKIVYGGPLPPLDAKTAEALKNHDIIFAGTDVLSGNDPQETVYCLTCGFIFQAGSLKNWSRTAEDPKSFVKPFSSLVRDFPLPKKSQCQNIEYSQEVSGTLVRSERLTFTTTQAVPLLKRHVNEWAQAHGLPLAPTALPEQSPHPLYRGGKLLTEQYQYWGNQPATPVHGHVGFITYPEEGKTLIDLSITLDRSMNEPIDTVLKKAFKGGLPRSR